MIRRILLCLPSSHSVYLPSHTSPDPPRPMRRIGASHDPSPLPSPDAFPGTLPRPDDGDRQSPIHAADARPRFGSTSSAVRPHAHLHHAAGAIGQGRLRAGSTSCGSSPPSSHDAHAAARIPLVPPSASRDIQRRQGPGPGGGRLGCGEGRRRAAGCRAAPRAFPSPRPRANPGRLVRV